jgi:hypothetical protein
MIREKLGYLTTTESRKMGILYIVLAVIDLYCWVMSLPGLATLLLFAMQAVTVLVNVAVPKLIGAPDLLA